MHTRSSPSVTERGRVTVPCKDWPSATASGGCGLDKGLPPGPRLPPRDRRWSPAGDEHRGLERPRRPNCHRKFKPLVFSQFQPGVDKVIFRKRKNMAAQIALDDLKDILVGLDQDKPDGMTERR